MERYDLKKLEEKVLKKDKEAMYELGKIYLNGTNGVNKNINKALELFKQGASLSNYDCIYEYAMLHLNQDTNIFNLEQGIKLLEKISEHHIDASFQLGKIYFYGFGKNKDLIQAEKFFRIAANGDNKEAAYLCGFIWENEFLDFKKIDEAFHFYQKAAKLGHLESIYKCGYYHYYGIDDLLNIDIDMSINFLKIAANLNHKGSLKLLAKIYIELSLNLLSKNIDDESSNIVLEQIKNIDYNLLVK